MLIPQFHSTTHQGSERVDYARIAEALTPQAVAAWFDSQGIDLNGLDATARNFLAYVRRYGATSAERLQQALGITTRPDFIEVDEYLVRLGLVSISSGGETVAKGSGGSEEGNPVATPRLDCRSAGFPGRNSLADGAPQKRSGHGSAIRTPSRDPDDP